MNHRQILFTDIETVTEFETFDQVPAAGRAAFEKRFKHKVIEKLGPKFDMEGPDAGEIADYQACMNEIYKAEAPFMAEYSKIVALAMGRFYQRDNSKPENPDYFRIKVLSATADPVSEKELLQIFCKAISPAAANGRPPFDFLCAHNGKQFDFPFITKRLMMFKIPVPGLLSAAFYKKPWEVPLIDTNEFWNATNKRTMISLDTIAYALGIPSPKEHMDGSMVEKYFREGKQAEINKYCGVDTITLASAFMVMTQTGQPITEEFIEWAN